MFAVTVVSPFPKMSSPLPLSSNTLATTFTSTALTKSSSIASIAATVNAIGIWIGVHIQFSALGSITKTKPVAASHGNVPANTTSSVVLPPAAIPFTNVLL